MNPLIIASLIGAGGSFLSSMLNKPPKVKTEQISRFSPEQRKLFKMITSQLSPDMIKELYGPIDEESLRQRFDTTVGDPARRQFTEDTVPELQELFASMGIGGGDAPQYQLATAGRRFNEDLARMFEQTRQGEIGARRNAIGSILGTQAVIPQQTITGGQDFSGIAGTTGNIAGNIFSNWLWQQMNQQQGKQNTQQPDVYAPFQSNYGLPPFNPMHGLRQ